MLFRSNDTATTEIYTLRYTLSLHDALPIFGGRWLRETHGFDSLPLYVRGGAVLPIGARDDRPDYDYLEGLTLDVYPGGEGDSEITVTAPGGDAAVFTITRTTEGATVFSTSARAFSVRAVGGATVASTDGKAEISW